MNAGRLFKRRKRSNFFPDIHDHAYSSRCYNLFKWLFLHPILFSPTHSSSSSSMSEEQIDLRILRRFSSLLHWIPREWNGRVMLFHPSFDMLIGMQAYPLRNSNFCADFPQMTTSYGRELFKLQIQTFYDFSIRKLI